MVNKRFFSWFCLIVLIGIIQPGYSLQEKNFQKDKIFCRATIYPTVSLSRYDYNNDIDLYELRAYVELRRNTQAGELITDALVWINSEPLILDKGQYKKRIKVEAEDLPDKIILRVEMPDGRFFEEIHSIPNWLILISPRPSIIDGTKELTVSWKFSGFENPVDIFIYNFKTGNEVCSKHDLKAKKIVILPEQIPKGTTVRIYVIHSWIYKKYLLEHNLVKGSEVNIIPWSQVFIRTKEETH